MIIKQLLKSLKLTILNVDYYRCDTNWHYQNVSSPFSRLYYVTSGEAYVTHSGTEYHLKPGSLHIIPCFASHDCHCPEQFEVFFVHFVSELEEGVDLFAIEDYDYTINVGDWAKTHFERLLEINLDKQLTDDDPFKPANKLTLKDNQEGSSYVSAGGFMESQGILRQLLAPFIDSAHEQVNNKMQAIHRLGELLRYIEKNLTHPISLTDLGEIACLDPGYLSKLFYSLMGVRPIEYINRKRIERAQRLLLCDNDIIDNIARKVGFSDWIYFSRVFKKQVGITPGQYRKQKHRL